VRGSTDNLARARRLIAGHEDKASRNPDRGVDPKEGAAVGQIADDAINGGSAAIEHDVPTLEEALARRFSLLLHFPPVP
jgi:hypothetical protein